MMFGLYLISVEMNMGPRWIVEMERGTETLWEK